jgi:hypothetical protein
MPLKQNTQTPNVAMPFNPDELIVLSERLRDFTTRLPVVGSPQLATPAGREAVLLASSAQLSTLTLTVSSAATHAQRNEQASLTTGLTRVASSFERMNTGMNTMLDAHKKMRELGKWTASSSFSYATGVLSLTAGAVSLFGGDGPNYNGVLSEIHAEINALRREYRADLLRVAEALQNDIRTVGKMVAQVMVNQQIILNAVHQALDSLDQIKTLLTEHVQTTGATLTHIATKDLRKARFIIEQYLDGTGISPDKPVLIETLTELQRWLKTELKHPVINDEQLSRVSSERMVEILNQQSTLNMPGLIASRLRFLFGNDIVDEKYTKLPSMEVFQSTAALFLLGAQKSQLFSTDAWEAMCQDIQNTFKLYSEFSHSLKGNTRLWQALFDLYDTRRDLVGMFVPAAGWKTVDSSHTPIYEQYKLALSQMEEIRLLLCALVHYVEGESSRLLMERILNLDSASDINKDNAQVKYANTAVSAASIKTPAEQYRFNIRSSKIHLAIEAWMPRCGKIFMSEDLFISDDVQKYIQRAVDVLFTNLLMPRIREHDKTYATGTYLAGSGSYYSYEALLSQPNVLNEVLQHTELKPYTFGQLVLNLISGYDLKKMHFISSFRPSSPGKNLEYTEEHPRYYAANWGRTSHFFSRSQDEMALIYAVQNGGLFLNKLRMAFEYFKLSSQGRLVDAALFSEKNKLDHEALLFLVAILGRWDIFDYFVRHFPLPDGFKYIRTLDGGSVTPFLSDYLHTPDGGKLTPLMLAAQHGREDVVNGLILNMTPAEIMKRSFENKTAAQLALEQGFYKIAYLLKAGLNTQEIQRCKDNIPAEPRTISNAPNPLVIALEQMRTEVERFKTEFKTQSEAKARTSAVVAASTAIARAEETDDDKAELLEDLTTEFFPEAAKARASFWTKPSNPLHQQTGKRMLPISIFEGDRKQKLRQQGKFEGKLLQEGPFVVTPDVIDDEECLVVMIRPRKIG